MFSIIYITAGDITEARKIGRILIEEHLAACANIFPITSIFRWKGLVDEASEFGIIVKTRTEKVKEIDKRVKDIHSYEVPCVVSFKIDNGSPDYLKWINDSILDPPDNNQSCDIHYQDQDNCDQSPVTDT